MRVLALTKYGMQGASARQRYGLYGPKFREAGIEFDFSPFLTDTYVANFSLGRRSRVGAAGGAFLRRMVALVRDVPKADAIWLQYEAFPYFPAAFERMLHRRGVPLVVDYDDAIFHKYDDSTNPVVRRILGEKLRAVIEGAAAVTVGNPYLADYARRWNDRVIEVPTVVDTDQVRPTDRAPSAVPVIGWMGSPSTWRYVRPLLPLLRELSTAGRAKVLVIGAGTKADGDRGGGIEFRPWTAEREVADLQEMDIGIMPVPDEPWERGKCGYKLVQYMATGLPSIASPIGVNATIVVDGETGILAETERAWRDAFETLLEDRSLAQAMGKAGRRRAVALYSLESQAPRLIELFRSLHDR